MVMSGHGLNLTCITRTTSSYSKPSHGLGEGSTASTTTKSTTVASPTPLMMAAARGNLEAVKKLLSQDKHLVYSHSASLLIRVGRKSARQMHLEQLRYTMHSMAGTDAS